MIEDPPSTEITCPVIKDDLSESKNDTSSPISSGSPILLSRDDFSSISFALGSASKYCLTPGVFIVPGETALTLIPFLATSLATDWVIIYGCLTCCIYRIKGVTLDC